MENKRWPPEEEYKGFAVRKNVVLSGHPSESNFMRNQGENKGVRYYN